MENAFKRFNNKFDYLFSILDLSVAAVSTVAIVDTC